MTVPRVAVAVAAAVMVAALAGCSSSTGGAGAALSGSAAMPAVTGAVDAPQAAVGAGAPGTSSSRGMATSITVGVPPSSSIERSVSATYTVAPRSFLASFEGVIARAVGLGGYVASSNTQPDRTGRIVSGAVTLKLPAARIADLLNGMPSTFTASSIDFATVDHTAQFVDVNARLASAHAHLAALNSLLARATSISDITNLEQQVAAVQAEADADQGELNVLTASVDLATATVRLSERGATVVAALPHNAVSAGIVSGWDNAVGVTGAVLEGALSALPLLVVALVGLLVWRRLGYTPPRRRAPARAAE